jgi:hypothetical protein
LLIADESWISAATRSATAMSAARSLMRGPVHSAHSHAVRFILVIAIVVLVPVFAIAWTLRGEAAREHKRRRRPF